MTAADDVNLHFGVTRRTAFSEYKQVRQPAQMIKHPNFTMADPPNDIALVKLKTRVEITDYVRPICLPPSGKTLSPGMSGYVAGWGKTSETGKR